MKAELELFERSKDTIWTDTHISKNMLAAHLDNESDGASRNIETVNKTVGWILSETAGKKSVVDLGCGPGLYAERLAKSGCDVTGIDVSKRSIRYAKASARKNGLRIRYSAADYIGSKIKGKYDIALCIYCDFGALIPKEQKVFLKNVYDALNSGGTLIFDVFSFGLNETKKEKRSWTYYPGSGFWCSKPHFVLEESVHFETAHAWGTRSIVFRPGRKKLKTYITWDQYYSKERIEALLAANGFRTEKIVGDLIDESNFTSSDVLFIKAVKI